jgi:hypothetical protein
MMAGISILLRLKGQLKGMLRMYIFRNPYDTRDLEVGIEQLDQYRPRILRNDGVKPLFSFQPSHFKPVTADQDRFSLGPADRQFIGIFKATRSEIREMLLADNSELCPEETECR